MVHFYKNREITTVIIPATPNAILLIAPCISPNSIDLAVPIAVLLQPKPTQIPTGFLMRSNFTNSGASTAPITPVKITPATVIPVMPPNFSLTPTAIGVVTV